MKILKNIQEELDIPLNRGNLKVDYLVFFGDFLGNGHKKTLLKGNS